MAVTDQKSDEFAYVSDPQKLVEFKMPRASIVRAAQLAIRSARRHQDVDRATACKLMKIARTAPEFVLGGWYVEGRCGCLVGNLFGHDPFPAWDEATAGVSSWNAGLASVGAAFDDRLEEALTPKQTNTYYDLCDSPAIVVAV